MGSRHKMSKTSCLETDAEMERANCCFLCLRESNWSSGTGWRDERMRYYRIVLKYLLRIKSDGVGGGEREKDAAAGVVLDSVVDIAKKITGVFCCECEKEVVEVVKLHCRMEAVEVRLVQKLQRLTEVVKGSQVRVVDGEDAEDTQKTLAKFHREVVENEKKRFFIPRVNPESYTEVKEEELRKIFEDASKKRSETMVKEEEDCDRDDYPPEDFVAVKMEIADEDESVHQDSSRLRLENCSLLEVQTEEDTNACTSSIFTPPSSSKIAYQPVRRTKSPMKRRRGVVPNQLQRLRAKRKLKRERKERNGKIVRCLNGRPRRLTEDEGKRIWRKLPRNVCPINSSFTCETCQFNTKVMYHFIQHLRGHETEEKTLECTVDQECHQKFTGKQYYELHMKFHQEKKLWWMCELCHERMPPPKMTSHMQNRHGAGMTYPCPYCDYCSPSVLSVVDHFRHHRGVQYVCFLCSVPLQTYRKKLIKHLYKEHGFTELMIKCTREDCSAQFIDTVSFRRHMNEHNRKFVCEKCNKVFRTNHFLQAHIKKVCDGPKKKKKESDTGEEGPDDEDPKQKKKDDLTCDICSESFSHLHKIERHRIIQHGFPTFKCGQCSKEYKDSKQLLRHQRMYHRKDGVEYVCPTCKKKCPNWKSLDDHVRYHHSEIKEHVCDQCGKVFKTRVCLSTHRRRHGGDEVKNFGCSECGKRFLHRLALKEHMTVHTGERPYCCECCGASYKRSYHLTQHKKKHQQEGRGSSKPISLRGPNRHIQDKKLEKPEYVEDEARTSIL